MKEIHKVIFELAKPYYLRGRPYDIQQIEWMIGHVEKLVELEKLDEDLLMPLCLLHDIGYSKLAENNPNPKSKEPKKIHMAEGARLAREILDKVQCEKVLSDRIVYYISVHDNWILGDDSPYQECADMAVFNDLDFIYAVADQLVLTKQAEAMNKTLDEMYDFWIHDEKLERRPFCCKYTKDLFYAYMENLKK